MKKGILLVIVILLSSVELAPAQERKLGVTVDVTYMSKYIDKGGQYFGDQSAIAETIDIDLYTTGFGLLVHNRRANSSGYENKEKFKHAVYYHNSLFDNEAYKMNYKVTCFYHHYVDEPRNKANKYEWIFEFAWPQLLQTGLVPKYTTYYMYPAGSNYDNHDCTGWLHRFGLGYDLTISELPEQTFHLSASAWYRDGMGSATKDHDWSHAKFGISTKFKITQNISFVPALYYQSSWDDSVNDQNELYCKLGMKYKF